MFSHIASILIHFLSLGEIISHLQTCISDEYVINFCPEVTSRIGPSRLIEHFLLVFLEQSFNPGLSCGKSLFCCLSVFFKNEARIQK